MGWIDAFCISADMVNLMAGWDIANKSQIGRTMGSHANFSVPAKHAIAALGQVSFPFPTSAFADSYQRHKTMLAGDVGDAHRDYYNITCPRCQHA